MSKFLLMVNWPKKGIDVEKLFNFSCSVFIRPTLLVMQHIRHYRKVPKFSDYRKLCCKLPKIQTKRPNHRIFCPKAAIGIANSEDPDQTAPLGAVWSGSALFALTFVSANLWSLRYVHFDIAISHLVCVSNLTIMPITASFLLSLA